MNTAVDSPYLNFFPKRIPHVFAPLVLQLADLVSQPVGMLGMVSSTSYSSAVQTSLCWDLDLEVEDSGFLKEVGMSHRGLARNWKETSRPGVDHDADGRYTMIRRQRLDIR